LGAGHIDGLGIVFIIVPIISPIAPMLGFDEIRFAMMIYVNLPMAFMTPPFAGAIFVCKGTAAPELGITMGDIIRGVWPYVFLVMVGLALCVAFPDIIPWLPNKMIK
jgi:TRAP-type mannitol/chloroaromatic compound transport system permease large subunit